jgi:very-short-patch-repair endonuclease
MNEKPIHVKRDRELRQRMTEEEEQLWEKLRNRKFHNLKFLRQHPVIYEIVNNESLYFIADFYCAERKLIIEVDGRIHDFRKSYDKDRDEILRNLNMVVLRIQNCEMKDISNVLFKLEKYIEINSPRLPLVVTGVS